MERVWQVNYRRNGEVSERVLSLVVQPGADMSLVVLSSDNSDVLVPQAVSHRNAAKYLTHSLLFILELVNFLLRLDQQVFGLIADPLKDINAVVAVFFRLAGGLIAVFTKAESLLADKEVLSETVRSHFFSAAIRAIDLERLAA